MTNPVLVEVTRGALVESRHRAAVVVALPTGEQLLSLGAVGEAVYPRSSVKPFQALAWVAHPGFDDLGLTDAEIALTCASHGGEPAHIDTVRAILRKTGGDESALECGPSWPTHRASARAVARNGGDAGALFHPCSGKHAGMLALARLLGVSSERYVEPEHPVQRRIAAMLESVCGKPAETVPCGIDGCSVPTWALPLDAVARGFARFANGEGLVADLTSAAGGVGRAMMGAPFMVAGTGRFCTAFTEAAAGRAVVKTGAEGMMCASLPQRNLGIAVKCDDGAKRGAETVMAHLLAGFGAVDADDPNVGFWLTRPVLNANGRHTGDIRAAPALREALAPAATAMMA